MWLKALCYFLKIDSGYKIHKFPYNTKATCYKCQRDRLEPRLSNWGSYLESFLRITEHKLYWNVNSNFVNYWWWGTNYYLIHFIKNRNEMRIKKLSCQMLWHRKIIVVKWNTIYTWHDLSDYLFHLYYLYYYDKSYSPLVIFMCQVHINFYRLSLHLIRFFYIIANF